MRKRQNREHNTARTCAPSVSLLGNAGNKGEHSAAPAFAHIMRAAQRRPQTRFHRGRHRTGTSRSVPARREHKPTNPNSETNISQGLQNVQQLHHVRSLFMQIHQHVLRRYGNKRLVIDIIQNNRFWRNSRQGVPSPKKSDNNNTRAKQSGHSQSDSRIVSDESKLCTLSARKILQRLADSLNHADHHSRIHRVVRHVHNKQIRGSHRRTHHVLRRSNKIHDSGAQLWTTFGVNTNSVSRQRTEIPVRTNASKQTKNKKKHFLRSSHVVDDSAQVAAPSSSSLQPIHKRIDVRATGFASHNAD